MKTLLVFKFLLICSVVLSTTEMSEIVSFTNERSENGYHFEYTIDDGTRREETGLLKKDTGKDILLVTGTYSYIDSDNKLRSISYQADEMGYRERIGTPLGVPGSDQGTLPFTEPTQSHAIIPIVGGGVYASLAGGGLG